MAYPPCTPEQFEQWWKLVDEGRDRFHASREAGTTLHRLKEFDRDRFDAGVALSLERAAAQAKDILDAELAKEDPSPNLVALEAKAHHPDYADRVLHEHGGRVEHEVSWRFNIDDLARIAAERGIIDARPVAALPRPAEVLPDPAERAASDLSAA